MNNTTVNTTRSGIEKIIEIMSRDMIYIPKAACREWQERRDC